MSDVIRNAIVKLGIQLATTDLKIPQLAPAIKQQKELADAQRKARVDTKDQQQAIDKSSASFDRWQASAKAAHERMRDVAKEQRIVTKATAELDAMVKMEAASVADSSRAMENAAGKAQRLAAANVQVVDSYRKAAAGAMLMARGVAFLASAQSESIQKAMGYLFAIQGLMDISKGGTQVSKALAAAHKAQAAAALAGAGATGSLAAALKSLVGAAGKLNLVLIAGAIIFNRLKAIYDHFVPSTAALAEEEAKLTAERERANEVLEMARERYNRIIEAEFKQIEVTASLTEKEKALREAMEGPTASNDPEHRLRAAEMLLDVEKQQADEAKKKIQDQIQLVELKNRELNTAREALKVEGEKSRALRASVGALEAGEKRRLDKLVGKVEGGGELNRREALELQKLGSDAGSKIAERFLEKLDQGLGRRLENAASKLTGDDPRAKAKAEFQAAKAAFEKSTSGKSFSDAIRDLQQGKDEIVDGIDDLQEALISKMRQLIDAVRDQDLERSRQRQAARSR